MTSSEIDAKRIQPGTWKALLVIGALALTGCNGNSKEVGADQSATTSTNASDPTQFKSAALANFPGVSPSKSGNSSAATQRNLQPPGGNATNPPQEKQAENVIIKEWCTLVNPIANMPYCSGNAHHCQDSYTECRSYCNSHSNPITSGWCLYGCDYGFNACVASQIGGTTFDCDDFARAFQTYVCSPNSINSWILTCKTPRGGHALNVVQMPSDGLATGLCKYCAIEPQRGGSDPKQNKGCWTQSCASSPTVPSWIEKDNQWQNCSTHQSLPHDPGEPDPLLDPAKCSEFVKKTGIKIACPQP